MPNNPMLKKGVRKTLGFQDILKNLEFPKFLILHITRLNPTFRLHQYCFVLVFCIRFAKLALLCV